MSMRDLPRGSEVSQTLESNSPHERQQDLVSRLRPSSHSLEFKLLAIERCASEEASRTLESEYLRYAALRRRRRRYVRWEHRLLEQWRQAKLEKRPELGEVSGVSGVTDGASGEAARGGIH